MNHDASGKRERKYNQNRKACIWYFTPDRESQCIHPGHASFQWDAAHSGSQRSQCKIAHFTMERRWSGMISPNDFSKTWNIESPWGRHRHIYLKTLCLIYQKFELHHGTLVRVELCGHLGVYVWKSAFLCGLRKPDPKSATSFSLFEVGWLHKPLMFNNHAFNFEGYATTGELWR